MYSMSHVKTSTEPCLTSFTSEKLPQSSPHQSPKSPCNGKSSKNPTSVMFYIQSAGGWGGMLGK